MPDLTAAEAYAREHLAELARELIEWEDAVYPGQTIPKYLAFREKFRLGVDDADMIINRAALERAARGE